MRWNRIAVAAGLVAVVVVPFASQAAPTPPAPAFDPVRALEPFFQQRETLAPPHVRTRLQKSRAAVAQHQKPTLFAYTGASDRPLAQLTGLVEPADPIKFMQAHNAKHAAQIAQAQTQTAARVAAVRAQQPQRMQVTGQNVAAVSQFETLDDARADLKKSCTTHQNAWYVCKTQAAYQSCMLLLHHRDTTNGCEWTDHPETTARYGDVGDVIITTQTGCVPNGKSFECWSYDAFLTCKEYWRGGSKVECAYQPPAHFSMAFGGPLPARFDWRSAHILPPVRDQLLCGSCWAFASVGALEAGLAVEKARRDIGKSTKVFAAPYQAWTIDFSEQEVLSCSGAGDCKGGSMDDALDWMKTHALYTESSDPYAARADKCHAGTSTSVKVAMNGFIDASVVVPSRATLKQYIAHYGPIAVTMYAYDDLQDYAGNVYRGFPNGPMGARQPDGHLVNHAVILVGWDDGEGAWIVRNSWGADWGSPVGYSDSYRHYKSYWDAHYTAERGYALIAYDTANIGAFARMVLPDIP